MALIVEAAELVEHFQWLNEVESQALPPENLTEVEHELADIQIYLPFNNLNSYSFLVSWASTASAEMG